jgi:hypothetical protein
VTRREERLGHAATDEPGCPCDQRAHGPCGRVLYL